MGFIPTNKVTQQAIKAVAVDVSSSDVTLAIPGGVLYIGVGGDLKVTTISGDTLEFRNLASGSVLAVQVKKVFAAGTTGTVASGIVALY
jgi:hypothetical protein